MAETQSLEKEYTIPLRKYWLRVPIYKRSGRAIKAIKQFIAKHMRIAERDSSKVKLDIYFNNELWFRGRANPPAKVKVRAVKEGEIVKVTFAEIPEYVSFLKKKHEKLFKKPEKKEIKAEPAQPEVKAEEKTEEQKLEEKEKESSVAEQSIKEADKQAKMQKHLTKLKAPKIHRMALKK